MIRCSSAIGVASGVICGIRSSRRAGRARARDTQCHLEKRGPSMTPHSALSNTNLSDVVALFVETTDRHDRGGGSPRASGGESVSASFPSSRLAPWRGPCPRRCGRGSTPARTLPAHQARSTLTARARSSCRPMRRQGTGSPRHCRQWWQACSEGRGWIAPAGQGASPSARRPCRVGKEPGAIAPGRPAFRSPFHERFFRNRPRATALLARQHFGRLSIPVHSRKSCRNSARHFCTKKAHLPPSRRCDSFARFCANRERLR